MKDRIGCIVGETMVRNHLIRHCGWKNDDILFTRNEWQKPYLVSDQPLHFNLSHSGNWVVCAWDNQEIGVDIEIRREVPMDAINMLFHPDEIKVFETQRTEDYFTLFWTLKESYMKYRGMGFYLPMNAFCLKEGADGYREKTDSRVKFYHRKMDEESYLSICTGNQNKLYYKKVDMKEVMDLPNIIGEQK